MFCSRCGVQLEERDRFCKACGQEVDGVANAVLAPSSVQPPGNPLPGWTSPSVSYAGFWARAVALLVDGLILGIPFSLIVIAFIFLLGGFGLMLHRNADVSALMVGPIVLSVVSGILCFVALEWLYFAGLESSSRQATLGKSLMSIRVTDLQGRRLSFGHATGRFFAKIVTRMIPLGIGFIMAGFTAKKQALHDLIAGTLVVKW